MNLFRPALAAVLVSWALPAGALADPSVSVSSTQVGDLMTLPAKVKHRLTLTAGATGEKVVVSAFGTLRVTGAAVEKMTATGPPAMACGTRWTSLRDAFSAAHPHTEATLTLAPFATAYVDTTAAFVHPPRGEETLDVLWEITSASGSTREINSPAPAYPGPRGVNLVFNLTRRSALVYAVKGRAPGAGSGHINLWAYPPSSERATRVATTPVRSGRWAINRLRLPRAGKWEFFARYKTDNPAIRSDVSGCGTPVNVR